MGAIASILVAGGLVALVYAAFMKFRSGKMAKAPFVSTGDASQKGDSVAGEKGAISVEGAVDCPAPLISPATQTPCLYYELKVVGSWKQGDSNKSKTYLEEKTAAEFSLNDGSGSVSVIASQGGDFDLKQTFNETKKEGMFADLKNIVGKKEPVVFGTYAFENPPASKANKFQCTEKLVPVPEKLFAMGQLHGNAIGAPSGMGSLVLSPKGREALMGSTLKHMKMSLIGGAASIGTGGIVGIISSFM